MAFKKLVTLSILVLLSGCSEPDFQDVAGNDIYLSDLNKKWLVVNYWATWCAPCIAEIPELNELAAEHSEKLIVIGVNYDQPDFADSLQQVKKMKIEFPVLRKEPSKKFGIEIPKVLPTTYIFAPGGELKKTLVGPQTKEGLLSLVK
ncbi:MAG: thiol-disulfide isomerase/thioredoxin [Candidatus Azotimanducaceae bacterium]|jgi:thiol-disulfide isomerase/thioredoxin